MREPKINTLNINFAKNEGNMRHLPGCVIPNVIGRLMTVFEKFYHSKGVMDIKKPIVCTQILWRLGEQQKLLKNFGFHWCEFTVMSMIRRGKRQEKKVGSIHPAV